MYEELTPAMIEEDARASVARQAEQNRRITEREKTRKTLLQDDYPYPVEELNFGPDGVEIHSPTMADYLKRQADRHDALLTREQAAVEGHENSQQLRLDDQDATV